MNRTDFGQWYGGGAKYRTLAYPQYAAGRRLTGAFLSRPGLESVEVAPAFPELQLARLGLDRAHGPAEPLGQLLRRRIRIELH